MYLKRLLAFLCCFTLVFCLFPSSAFATGGNGNIDGGGGGMGQGTSSNFWTPGNDGVRITVVDASSGTAVSSPLDFSNRTQKTRLLHFGKVNKLQYLSGTGLSLQSGAAYSCIKPAQSMPTIVSSKGQSNIEAIKRYFCSEYACMMVAQAAGVDYERMIAGEYKLLIEPIAYFTHNGQYDALYDLLGSLSIIPTSGPFFLRLASFVKLTLLAHVPVSATRKLFQKDKRTKYEALVMRLAGQALLSTAEIIKCIDKNISRLPNECALLDSLYGDETTTSDNIASMVKISQSSKPVTLAVANLYLRQQIIFERV